MSVELYNANNHVCVVFRHLVTGYGAQSNQFVIADHGVSVLIDPGGELTYARLFVELGKYTYFKHLKYVIVSHQDPDAAASVNSWLEGSDCQIVVPTLWEHFIPHLVRARSRTSGVRQISIPDEGVRLSIGNFELIALPAHFLHAERNFQFYDPVAKILFSGDMGANVSSSDKLGEPVRDLAEVTLCIDGFHKRCMNGNRACRFWANMVKDLEICMMVPQHGRALVGDAIGQFIEWISELRCGLDLMTQDNYRLPSAG